MASDELFSLRAEVERLRADNARLRRQASELRTALDTIPLAVMIRDRQGRVLYANPLAATGYVVPLDQAIGRHERELFHRANPVDAMHAHDREVIDGGVPGTSPQTAFTMPDGRLLTLYFHKYPIQFQGQPAVLVGVYDLTEMRALVEERARLERKVLETQRLESLGVMAGGIAHDFNNLLVGVLANAELALGQVDAQSHAARYLHRLRAAAERLASLSRQMLAYSGRSRITNELLDVGAAASELAELLDASIPKNTRVQLDVEPALPPILADAAQIRQVVMNLITNAAEAMSERGGVVQVSLRRERFDPREHRDLTLGAALPVIDAIALTVRDTGVGMEARTLHRLFDPFFTTKSTGRGLGLSAVLGIVRGHDGALAVCSTAGVGTTFRVWLPIARAVDAPRPPQAPDRSQAAVTGKRVLVVDDEPIVRQAASALLETCGFVVDAVENGDRAIAALHAGLQPDAVLLDMSMPGRPVAQTFAALRSLHPRLPVVLTSGFADHEIVRELLLEPATAFVAKPFTAQTLVDVLHALLQRG